MEKLYVPRSEFIPEINLSPEDNVFSITGISRPENIRLIYEPVIDWMTGYKTVLTEDYSVYSVEKPFILKLDLEYFNSSTVKFLFDIIRIVKSMKEEGIPIVIQWFYDLDDQDCLEAGEDLAALAEIDFTFIERQQ